MTAEQRRNVKRYLDYIRKNGKSRRRIDGKKVSCEECGSLSGLEWHHLRYWSEGGDDSPQNLIVLCHSCHANLHKSRNDYRRAGQWGGLVSAYVREQRLGRDRFRNKMKTLAQKRWAS